MVFSATRNEESHSVQYSSAVNVTVYRVENRENWIFEIVCVGGWDQKQIPRGAGPRRGRTKTTNNKQKH